MARLKLLPVPEVRELEGREAYDTLISDFGLLEPSTEPMPLDELPEQPQLVPIERDGWARLVRDLGGAGR